MQTDTEVTRRNLVLKARCFSGLRWQKHAAYKHPVSLTNAQSKHSEYDVGVEDVVIYWYDALKRFYSLKCSHALYLTAITSADCFAAVWIEFNCVGSSVVRHLCTVCVGMYVVHARCH